MPSDAPARSQSSGRPGRESFRSRHRARSHEEAHDDPGGRVREREYDHPLIPPAAVEMVDADAGLAPLLARLRAAGAFAYDTEFIGESSYHPVLCLIQVATPEFVALIDPMGGVDLTPFWELLADPAVRKLVHAGEQDLEPVVRHLGTRPANVIDTQIAAGFARMAYPVSLTKLLAACVGVELGKGLTFTDWSQRPLSAKQVRYAADDVRFLPAAWDALEKMLARPEHRDWLTAECDARCDPANFLPNPEADARRVKGSAGLDARETAILHHLVAWRQKATEAADLPPRAFLKDEVLIALARMPAKSLDKLQRVRNLPRPVIERYGEEIVAAVRAGMDAPPADVGPRLAEPTPADRFNADAAIALAGALTFGRGVDLALIANKQDLTDFHRLATTGGPLDGLRVMAGWRRKALGDPMLRALRGEEVLSVKWSDGTMQTDC